MRLTWWIGHSGTSAVIAAQLGLAMMPLWSAMRRGIDLRHHQRHALGSMRKADELSTTTAPAFTAIGRDTVLEMPPPAENSAMSTPLKASSVSSSISQLLAAEGLLSCRPSARRPAASAMPAGKPRLSMQPTNSGPRRRWRRRWLQCLFFISFFLQQANKKAPSFRAGLGSRRCRLLKRARSPGPAGLGLGRLVAWSSCSWRRTYEGRSALRQRL